MQLQMLPFRSACVAVCTDLMCHSTCLSTAKKGAVQQRWEPQPCSAPLLRPSDNAPPRGATVSTLLERAVILKKGSLRVQAIHLQVRRSSSRAAGLVHLAHFRRGPARWALLVWLKCCCRTARGWSPCAAGPFGWQAASSWPLPVTSNSISSCTTCTHDHVSARKDHFA